MALAKCEELASDSNCQYFTISTDHWTELKKREFGTKDRRELMQFSKALATTF
jgi:hypothetical protein